MTPTGNVYLVSGVTDMRKSIDGLSLIVADTLEMDPFSQAWFIFCNRHRDKLKILFWDTNGFGFIIVASKKATLSGQHQNVMAQFISASSNYSGYYRD